MNATAAAIDVIRRRVKATRDYSTTEYYGDKPLLNWSAFLMHLDARGALQELPRFKNFRK
jgi:hypothetical protein